MADAEFARIRDAAAGAMPPAAGSYPRCMTKAIEDLCKVATETVRALKGRRELDPGSAPDLIADLEDLVAHTKTFIADPPAKTPDSEEVDRIARELKDVAARIGALPDERDVINKRWEVIGPPLRTAVRQANDLLAKTGRL